MSGLVVGVIGLLEWAPEGAASAITLVAVFLIDAALVVPSERTKYRARS